MPVEVRKVESNSPQNIFDKSELDRLVEKSLVTLQSKYERETYILQIYNGEDNLVDICSIGNISATVGGAKSRKTFFSTMMLSSFSSNEMKYGFKSFNLGKKGLFIDTEQAPFHVQKVAKRINDVSGTSEYVDLLYLRHCTDMDTRLAVVDYYLSKNANKYSFVIIDGVVDLVNDYNNQAECRKVISMIMSWSDIYKIHINCVIHTNKDQGYARGHLGAELMNKSETVFRTQKNDQSTTTVSCEASRNRSFESFDFTIDRGIPKRDVYPNGYYDNTPKQNSYEYKPNETIEPSKEFEEPEAPF